VGGAEPIFDFQEFQMESELGFVVDVLCLGHASFDLTMGVEHHPGPDEKCFATALVKCGGGPAANASVAVARLGGTSAFAGYLGSDLYGTEHFEELQIEGVRTDFVVRGTPPTPLSCILVKPNGGRTVINDKTHTPMLEIDQIDFACCTPKVILFDGHEPLISLPLAKSVRGGRVITILDAGSVHQGTLELAPLVDYLVASEKFARDFTGERDMVRALRALSLQASSVVITLGEKGLIWKSGESEGSLPAFAIEALDTTGAGDTFHGAFALEIALKESFSSAMLFASAAAALSCQKLGARLSIPVRKDVESFLRTQEPASHSPSTAARWLSRQRI
jgi:sulfofructose kinase